EFCADAGSRAKSAGTEARGAVRACAYRLPRAASRSACTRQARRGAMRSPSVPGLLLISLAAVALPGCGTSAPARLYRLDSAAIPSGAPAVRTAVMVGPVAVPAAVDRPEFVVQVAPNRVEVEE